MKCFVDMDGVVADFVKAVHKAHNRPYAYNDPKNMGVFEIEKIWGISIKEFWKYDGHDFWAMVEKTPEADDIVKMVCDYFDKENIVFLTAPSNSGGCYTGKREWLKTNFPDLRDSVIFAPGRTKHFLARPGAVLIDDRNENADDFVYHGGQAILVPRDWNRLYYNKDVLYAIRVGLENLQRF